MLLFGQEKSGSDAECHSHENFPYGHRGETKFPTKFFCFLFFQEKKVGATQNVTPTKNLPYGRRRETKFPTKFFAKLSFKKAAGAEEKRSFAENSLSTFFKKVEDLPL